MISWILFLFFNDTRTFLLKARNFFSLIHLSGSDFSLVRERRKKCINSRTTFCCLLSECDFFSFLCFIKRFQLKIKEESWDWDSDRFDLKMKLMKKIRTKAAAHQTKLHFSLSPLFFHLLLRNEKIPPFSIEFVSHLRVSGFISNFRLLNEWRKKFDFKLSFFSVEVLSQSILSIMPTWPPFRIDKQTKCIFTSLWH